MSSRRIGGLAGLVFVSVVAIVNILLGSAQAPQAGASKAEVLAFLADHGSVVAVATSLATVVWVALAVFSAGVVAAVRGHERSSGDSWSLLTIGGAIMQNSVFAMVVAIQVTVSVGGLSDDLVWGLWRLHDAVFSLNGASLAIVLVGGSIGAHRAGLLTGWQRTLGLVAATALFASAFLTPFTLDGHPVGLVGLAGFLMWLVWIASVSVALLRGGARSSEVATERVAAAV